MDQPSAAKHAPVKKIQPEEHVGWNGVAENLERERFNDGFRINDLSLRCAKCWLTRKMSANADTVKCPTVPTKAGISVHKKYMSTCRGSAGGNQSSYADAQSIHTCIRIKAKMAKA